VLDFVACNLDDRAADHYMHAISHNVELFKRIQPADYLSRFLEEGYRPDGRRAEEFREPALNAGTCNLDDCKNIDTSRAITNFCSHYRFDIISRWLRSSEIRRDDCTLRY